MRWICTYLVKLIDLLQKAGEQEDHGLLNRLLLCRFLAASTLVVLARAEDNIERAVSHQKHEPEERF